MHCRPSLSFLLFASLASASYTQTVSLEKVTRWNFPNRPVVGGLGDFTPGLNGETIAVMQEEDLILSRISKQGAVLASGMHDQPGGGREFVLKTFVDAQGQVYVFYHTGPLPQFQNPDTEVRLAKFSAALGLIWDRKVANVYEFKVFADSQGFYYALNNASNTVLKRTDFEGATVWTRSFPSGNAHKYILNIDTTGPRLVITGQAAYTRGFVSSINKATGADISNVLTDEGYYYTDVSVQTNGAIYAVGRKSPGDPETIRTAITPTGVATSFTDPGRGVFLVRSRTNPSEIFTTRVIGFDTIQVERRNAATDALLASHQIPGKRVSNIALSRDGSQLGVVGIGLDNLNFGYSVVNGGSALGGLFDGDPGKVTYSGHPSTLIFNDGGYLKHHSATNAFRVAPDQPAPLGHVPIATMTDPLGGRLVVTDVGENKAGGGYALTKFSASGQTIWSRLLFAGNEYPLARVQAGVTADGSTLIAAGTGSQTRILRYNANGALTWDRTLDNFEFGGMAVQPDGVFFVAKTNGEIRKLSTSGTQVWSRSNAAWLDIRSLQVLANGDVAMLMGAYDLRVVLLSATGGGKWSKLLEVEPLWQGKLLHTSFKTHGASGLLVTGQYNQGSEQNSGPLHLWRLDCVTLTVPIAYMTHNIGAHAPAVTGMPNGNVALLRIPQMEPPTIHMVRPNGELLWTRTFTVDTPSGFNILADSQNNVYATFKERSNRDVAATLVKLSQWGDPMDRKSFIGEKAMFNIAAKDKVWAAFGSHVYSKGLMLTFHQYRQFP